MKFLSSSRFLAVYSGVLTVAFILAVSIGIRHEDRLLRQVSAAEQHDYKHPDFDQITVHRINIVEPDGTPRLIIADKAEFPGEFSEGKEIARPGRTDSAGMLFVNEEGTEDGGLLFGGNKGKDGKLYSWGHLSFDEYEQDQALALDMEQEGDQRASVYQVNDNAPTLLTPDLLVQVEKIRAMPDGPEKTRISHEFSTKHPMKLRPRASLAREADKSATLRLRDPDGNTRILLRVAADGTPSMQFLDAAGKLTHSWPDDPPRRN
jgi:hypothetical protein